MTDSKTTSPTLDVNDLTDIHPIINITRRLDWIIAGGISFVMFLFYFFTSSRWAFPGESSHLMAILTGLHPNTTPDHMIWHSLMSKVTNLAGQHHAVEAVTIIGMLFSALSLGLLYLITTAAFNLFIEKDANFDFSEEEISDEMQLKFKQEADRYHFHALFAARFGGFISALTLAFSAPFWVSASRVNIHAFYLLWLLVATYLILKFISNGNIRLLYSVCLLCGIGVFQSAIMIQFFPMFVILAIIGMIRFDKFTLFIVGGAVAIFALASTATYMLSLNTFVASPEYALLEFDRKAAVAILIIKNLILDAVSALPKSGWMIVIALVVVPWLTWILIAFRTLNGESGPAMKVLHYTVLLVTLTIVLDSRISPWQFFGMTSPQALNYTMVAMTLGYCVTSAYMFVVHLFERSTQNRYAKPVKRTLRALIFILTATVLIWEIKINSVHAETKNTRFITTYINRLIDNLDGHNWIVTDGAFDDMILLRAQEREISLNLIDLSAMQSSVYVKLLKQRIPSARLRNSLDVGVSTFLQEWIETDSNVTDKLTLCLYPDLWSAGNYSIYPSGLTFNGAASNTPELSSKIHNQDNIATYFSLMDELDKQLEDVDEDSSSYVHYLARAVRGRVSFIGNNLGYFLENQGFEDDAFKIYKRVHEFDSRNVSAMLNYAFLLNKFGTQEQKDAIKLEIESFKKNQKRPLQIWELSRTQGYVNSPEAFLYLGWTWALSGESTIAINTLRMALGNDYDTGTYGMMSIMANIHAKRGETKQTEQVLEKVLKNNPNHENTLLSLIQVKILRGDVAGAQKLLDHANAIGIAAEKLRHQEVALKLAANDTKAAKQILYDLLDSNSKDSNTRLSLYMTLASEYQNTNDAAKKDAIRDDMVEQIDRLMENPEARYFQGAIAQGHLYLIENNLAEAREKFLLAKKTAPDVLSLLEAILRIDYRLNDIKSAEEHAFEILKITPDHSFSNYILGSIALSKGNFESAEGFLEQSTETAESVLALGDLAYVKLQLDKIDEAHTLVLKALAQTKAIYEIWDTYGQILFNQQKLDEAADALRTALKLNAQNPTVHLHLARVLFDQGKIEDSQRIMEELQNVEVSLSRHEQLYYDKLWHDLFKYKHKGS